MSLFTNLSPKNVGRTCAALPPTGHWVSLYDQTSCRRLISCFCFSATVLDHGHSADTEVQNRVFLPFHCLDSLGKVIHHSPSTLITSISDCKQIERFLLGSARWTKINYWIKKPSSSRLLISMWVCGVVENAECLVRILEAELEHVTHFLFSDFITSAAASIGPLIPLVLEKQSNTKTPLHLLPTPDPPQSDGSSAPLCPLGAVGGCSFWAQTSCRHQVIFICQLWHTA